MLFWNLLINLSFFTIGSMVGIELQRGGPGDGGRGFLPWARW